MQPLLDWYDRKPTATRLPLLLALAVLPVLLVTAAAFLLPAAAPFAGGIAGGCLFLAGYLAWHRLLNDDLRNTTDFRGNYALGQRRIGVGVAAALWVVVMAGIGPMSPGPVIGTANVFIALTLFWVVRASKEEAAEQLAKYEELQARKQAEAEAAARAEEYRQVYGDDVLGEEDDYLAYDEDYADADDERR